MTPEPTDALVERVRAGLQGDATLEEMPEINAALTELAERLKAAERERDECAVLLADTTLSTHDLAAQRDELVEALEFYATNTNQGETARAALAKHRDVLEGGDE